MTYEGAARAWRREHDRVVWMETVEEAVGDTLSIDDDDRERLLDLYDRDCEPQEAAFMLAEVKA